MQFSELIQLPFKGAFYFLNAIVHAVIWGQFVLYWLLVFGVIGGIIGAFFFFAGALKTLSILSIPAGLVAIGWYLDE